MMTCPTHHRRLLLEDTDSLYGQALYICPELCGYGEKRGPSDSDIYRAEHPTPSAPSSARPSSVSADPMLAR